ncbi:MAG: nucleotidyltransferase domain-containing protein [Candidatus Pacearchaeota archaeon]|nr:MAG: nucleotidyltransferase domain-containing protein [Candidatus Pacearchaeota archaeon]
MAKEKKVKIIKAKTPKVPKVPGMPKVTKVREREFPTLRLKDEQDIAYDFATKAYEKFGKVLKSVILFGSAAKGKMKRGSDIDIIVILDDCTIQWDAELIAWYREELGKLIRANPYRKPLHINSVRLSTWWVEMMRGEPVIINIIRWGQPLIDFGGFYTPLKVLLAQGKLKSTPEAIYIILQRAPLHLARTKASLLSSLEGLYWAMVDSSHAALIAAKKVPPSPEHIAKLLENTFVRTNTLDSKYVSWYRDVYKIAHDILHGARSEISGSEIDEWRDKTDMFVREMAKLIDKIISGKIKK